MGIASLILENASSGGGAGNLGTTKIFGLRVNTNKNKNMDNLGFQGGQISIPGLKKQDAETLKNILLQNIKANPIEDKLSGL